MEDVQHRVIWGRVFTVASILLGLAGVFSFGITSFIGAIVGFAAIKEKSLGKFWRIFAWVGTAICVAYFEVIIALSVAWHE